MSPEKGLTRAVLCNMLAFLVKLLAWELKKINSYLE